MHWSTSLAGYFLSTRLLGKRVPLLASFKLTYRCNLGCAGCAFHLRANRPNSHMTWETALESLDLLKRRGTRIVVFEGGEPLLWSHGKHRFVDLVERAKKMFLRVAATTNGTVPLDVPTDVTWVSIDGVKETHDRLRANSFDAAWENLRTTTHPKLLVHFTMNKENWRDLPAVMELLRQAPAVRGVTVQLFYPYDDGEEPLSLSRGERREAIEQAIDLKKRGYPILNSARRLRAMVDNRWECRDWMLANVDPDGTVTTGCYVKTRGVVKCEECGFTPVAEASGAYDLLPTSILAGWRTMISR